MNLGLDVKPKPFVPKRVQHNTAHSSMHDLGLAMQTEALWYSGTGQTHAYHWPKPSLSPFANIAAVDTWTDVLMATSPTNVKATFPWMSQNRTFKLYAVAVVALASSIGGLRIRLNSREADLDAATEELGPDLPIGEMRQEAPEGLWQIDDTPWRFFYCPLYVRTDASVRHVFLQVKQDTTISMFPSGETPLLKMRLNGFKMWDVFPKPSAD